MSPPANHIGQTTFSFHSSPDHPTELVVLYQRPSKLQFTSLYRRLREIDKDEVHLRRHFSAARHALIELGSCASDLLWRRALADVEAAVSEMDEDRDETEESVALLAARDLIKNWDFTMPNLDPSSRGFNVTPKFLKLVQIIRSCQPVTEAFRGIVFVRRRTIALTTVELLRTLDVGDIRPQSLVGHGSNSDPASQRELFHAFEIGTHNIIIATKGAEDLDIPPATAVIRYDLFDSQVSYANARGRTRGRESHLIHMLQRGDDVHRRRLTQLTQLDAAMQLWMDKVVTTYHGAAPPSTILETNDPYFSDSDNEAEEEVHIKDPTTSGRIRPQDATGIIYRFVASLPSTDSRSSNEDLFRYEEVHNEEYLEPRYICTVTLPPGPPCRMASGSVSPTKAHARRSASFQMCVALFELGVLDYHFFPRPPYATKDQRRIPDPAGFLDADYADGFLNLPPKGGGQSKTNGTRCYPRKQPDFWTNALTPTTHLLYPTIVSVDATEPHHPMLILTRLPLPSFPSFKLFRTGVSDLVQLWRGTPFEVDDDRRYQLYRYTTRVCRSIMNKPYVCRMDSMPYFFAPLDASWNLFDVPQDDRWRSTEVASHIPWDLVKLAAEKYVTELQFDDLEASTDDVIIQDRWIEFTRRYYVVKVRRDLTPLSKPDDSPREAGFENFFEYCKANRKDFDSLKDYDQPLIEVERVPPVLNRLHPSSKPTAESPKAPARYLIPELCAQLTISASTFRTALMLPSITRRIDDFLLVKELNATLFDNAIKEDFLLAAISAPSVGAEFDYERLELLGDAYLKYLTSIYLFVTNPSQNEGALHSARLRIISNKALLLNADSAGLPPFIQSKPFVSKVWQPPNFQVTPPPGPKKVEEGDEHSQENTSAPLESGVEPGEILDTVTIEEMERSSLPPTSDTFLEPTDLQGQPHDGSNSPDPEEATAPEQEGVAEEPDLKLHKRSKRKRQLEEQNIQWLGDKAVADVAEAIIGAAYQSGGREIALKASKALCIAVPRVDRWSDFARKALAPPPDVTAQLKPGSVEAVESILGHRFHRPHLLAQALTHASIQGYEMTCYERLEFIGDAILDFLVIRHIYERDTHLSPGALTLLKGAMVNNQALAAVCVNAGLHEYLMFESFNLGNNIQTFAESLRAKQVEEYNLAANEGRSPRQYWLEIEPPKALSDVVESVIGAIYISDDFSPDGIQVFYEKVLKPFYDRHITLRTLSHHPTKVLFELFQAEGCQSFAMVKKPGIEDGQHYTRSSTSLVWTNSFSAVVVHDVVLAQAKDITSSLAAKRAANLAFDALEGDPGFMARTCDCRAQLQAKRSQKKGVQPMLSDFVLEDEDAPARSLPRTDSPTQKAEV
ncbi:ribonuclease III [Auriscalpium vulgare]|uniref:Ribonuclease III n=1 Tax=Auriscalpium vulgare TaxID=40419 RepID=A0ACB8RZH2_9AGAM|nr:ribonuclease III [Auriscalpium vulgare]